MKARRVLYIVLGIVFFLLNIVSTVNMIVHHQFDATGNDDDFAYRFGSIIGSQVFLYISLLFWYGSYRVSRKIKVQRKHNWNAYIDEIGNNA